MNPSTFEVYKAATKLQDQALDAMNRLELLADHGVTKAEKLLNLAWKRYNRRAAVTSEAEYRHWGDL